MSGLKLERERESRPASYDDDKHGEFPSPLPEEAGLQLVRDWTDEEERRAKRK